MKEELFEMLDEMYKIMNPMIKPNNKEKWKEDTWKRFSVKPKEEQKEWIEFMWSVVKYEPDEEE